MVGDVALISRGGRFGGPLEVEHAERVAWLWRAWGWRVHHAPMEDEF